VTGNAHSLVHTIDSASFLLVLGFSLSGLELCSRAHTLVSTSNNGVDYRGTLHEGQRPKYFVARTGEVLHEGTLCDCGCCYSLQGGSLPYIRLWIVHGPTVTLVHRPIASSVELLSFAASTDWTANQGITRLRVGLDVDV
jgi:hypothetical protein